MNRHVRQPGWWSVAEAKARLSEVIDRARAGEPQHITRRGADAVVVVSVEEWARLSAQQATPERRGTIVEFFRSSPLYGAGLEFERLEGDLRDVDFGENEPEGDA